MNEGGVAGEREGGKKKSPDRKRREASPVRGLRASWKLPFGLGPSAVVELSCSFICFRLCDSRQKSDHRCFAWLAVAHAHVVHTYTQAQGLRPSHTRLTPSLISQFELFSCCLEETTSASNSLLISLRRSNISDKFFRSLSNQGSCSWLRLLLCSVRWRNQSFNPNHLPWLQF